MTTTKNFGPTAFTVGLILLLLFLKSPFGEKDYENSYRVPVKIIAVSNDNLRKFGVITQGEQTCEVSVLKGAFKNQTHEATNLLTGSLEQDKLFKPGDTALAVVDYLNDSIQFIRLIDYYRLPYELILIGIFICFLVGFSGWIGIRSLLSFIASLMLIWKVLIPGFLLGIDPIILGYIITCALTCIIIFLVYGIEVKAFSAILGSLLGSTLTLLFAKGSVALFNIHGAVMPHAESLLYAGFGHIDLTGIFTASIVIACSGAMMDIAVDITAAMAEIHEHTPSLTPQSLIRSGLNVGKAIMGTMTTTLLLAYSGSFISLLMVFAAQGTPIINILNLRIVSAEILQTIIGSLGLISVAPFTAFSTGYLLKYKVKKVALERA